MVFVETHNVLGLAVNDQVPRICTISYKSNEGQKLMLYGLHAATLRRYQLQSCESRCVLVDCDKPSDATNLSLVERNKVFGFFSRPPVGKGKSNTHCQEQKWLFGMTVIGIW